MKFSVDDEEFALEMDDLRKGYLEEDAKEYRRPIDPVDPKIANRLIGMARTYHETRRKTQAGRKAKGERDSGPKRSGTTDKHR